MVGSLKTCILFAAPVLLGAASQVSAQSELPGLEERPPLRNDLYGDPLPPGAIARMGTMQLWHYTNLGDIPAAFSPDGKVLTTAGVKSLRMWDMTTGKLLREIADNYHVSQIFCSPKGRFLATRGDKSINLRDPNTGQILHSISTSMWPSAFSPDDKLLVTTGSRDGSVDLWETATGKQVISLKGHKEGVLSPAFTSDGMTLFTMDFGKKVCLWNVATATLRKSFNMQVPQWRTLRLSPDGQTLAVASGKTVSFWDTETGEERTKLKRDLLPQGYGMAFTPDGKIFATARSESWADLGQISLWNARTGELIRSFPAPARAMIGLEFAPDNRTLLSSAGGTRLHLWDTQTGRELFVTSCYDDMIRSLAFTHDSKQVISMADNTVRLWDVSTGRQVRVVAHTPHGGSGLSLTRDGLAVLSGGYTRLRLNDLATGKELKFLALDEDPDNLPPPTSSLPGHSAHHVGLAADGRTAVSVSSQTRQMRPNAFGTVNVVDVWDVASGKAVARRELGYGHEVNFIGLAPGVRTLAISVSSLPPLQEKIQRDESNTYQVLIQDVLTGRNIVTLPQPDSYSRHDAFSPDGRTLVTTTNTVKNTAQGSEIGPATFHFWELATGKDRFSFQITEASRQHGFAQMAFLPGARILATIRYDGTIQLWDAVTGKELFRRTGSDSYVSALAVSHDGKFLVTGHQDSTILVWDLRTAKKPERLVADQPSKNQLEACWSDLAGADAAKAYRAIWCLAEAPPQAMAMYRDRVHVAKAVSEKEVNRLIADLDSGEFTKREAASRQLSDLGEQIEPFLEAALKAKPTGEQRRRIEQLLTAVHTVHSPDQLRSLRAIEALEHIGTPEAGNILQSLAKGPPAARQTREAQDSLDRLTWKPGAQR
jgi:WD40 repeat protein